MNRREFVKASAGLAATVSLARAPVSRVTCTPYRACAQPAIVIVDPTLFDSVMWVRVWNGARTVECGGDVAVLWYEMLVRLRVPLVGTLRASDFFVLRHLARSDGRVVAHEAAGEGTVAFHIMSESEWRSRWRAPRQASHDRFALRCAARTTRCPADIDAWSAALDALHGK